MSFRTSNLLSVQALERDGTVLDASQQTAPEPRRDTSAVERVSLPLIILKVAARCNLNCSYCYEFNLADTTWQGSPIFMSDAVFDQVLACIRRHCEWSGQDSVRLSIHGGEPCLLGTTRFNALCQKARQVLTGITVRFSIQTNGTLLNRKWAEVLAANEVEVGISMDGPKDVHDLFRVDKKGRGSYDRVREGMTALREGDVSFGILTVIQPGADPIAVHQHFLDLGCQSLSYLMPDYTHDTLGTLRETFGPTPCADFLIPIFDHWWYTSTMDVRIRNFWDMARIIMGGQSQVDALGNQPLRFVVINSAGDIEGLDVLKACGDGLVKTSLNVRNADFRDIARVSPLHGQMIFSGLPLPRICQVCSERTTCAGGYHPHRYSHARGFDNPSVWCSDLMRLFTHMRARLGVSVAETETRRQALEQILRAEEDAEHFAALQPV